MMYYQLISIVLSCILITLSLREMYLFCYTSGIRSFWQLKAYITRGIMPGEVTSTVQDFYIKIAHAIAQQNPSWSKRRVQRKAQRIVSETLAKSLKA